MDKEFRFLTHVEDIQNGQIKGFSIGYEKICLAKIDESFYAIEDFCSHAGGVMSTGFLDGVDIVCPLHGARFDIRTGKQSIGPSLSDQPIYPVQIEGGSVYVGTVRTVGI